MLLLILIPNEGDQLTTLIDGIFTSRPLARDISSDFCFELASYWLRTCLKTHGLKCQSPLVKLPTRVLDVGGLGDAYCRLHCSKGKLGDWFTLSHCWGGKVPMITTLGNFEARCEGMLLNDLPQTFQDAILITRKLGYQYLWIDSLCIIQDSKRDWEEESGKMADVYACAVLNISADSSANPYEGIFSPANGKKMFDSLGRFTNRPSRPQLTLQSVKRGIQSTVYVRPRNGNVPIDVASVLQERAWVFQEAALSHRRLRYTTDGLRWSCRAVHDTCHEYHPHEINTIAENKPECSSVYDIPKRNSSLSRYVRNLHRGPIRKEMIWWYDQVCDYVGRKLTYPTDRFPALSGLAHEFMDRTSYHYSTGIIDEDFRRGILWMTHGASVNLAYAPSWSWAVIDGVPRIEGQKCGIYDTWNMYHLFDCHEVVREGVFHYDSAPYTQLSLRGLCQNLVQLRDLHSFRFKYGDSKVEGMSRLAKIPTNEWNRIELSVDRMESSVESFLEREDVIFLQIACFTTGQFAEECSLLHTKFSHSYALILEPTGKHVEKPRGGFGEAYRRLGVAIIAHEGKEEAGWKLERFTII